MKAYKVRGYYSSCSFIDYESGLSYFEVEVDPASLSDVPAYSLIKRLGKEGIKYYIRVIGICNTKQRGLPLVMVGSFHGQNTAVELRAISIKPAIFSPEALKKMISEKTYEMAFPEESRLEAIRLLSGCIDSESIFEKMKLMIREKAIKPSVKDIYNSLSIQIDRQTVCNTIAQYSENRKGCNEYAVRVIESFPEDPLRMLLKYPYMVSDKARFPIAIADAICLHNANSDKRGRIETLTNRALSSIKNIGHVSASQDMIMAIINRYTENSPVAVSEVVACLNKNRAIQKAESDYYERYLLKAENEVVNHIKRLTASAVSVPWHPDYIDKIEKEMHVTYGKQQRDSFRLLKHTGIVVLTGGPGTGKTTTVNGLLRYCEMVGYAEGVDLTKMALAAPSGRASQRMAEATHRQASTCHRMINFVPYGECTSCKNLDDPIEAGVIVIDESSMLDIDLTARILGACKSGSLVLFVGDINQLQSVGPGAVLDDLIKSEKINVCQLTDVYRQKGGSPIPVNAAKIMIGRSDFEEACDFRTVFLGKGKAAGAASRMAQTLLEAGALCHEIQALSPLRNGDGGIYALNSMLQPILNPSMGAGKRCVHYGHRTYYEGDRVMMQSNNYQKGYFNGDTGVIKKITNSGVEIEVDDRKFFISNDHLCDTELSYCCTIHKSQGSEYPYTFIIMPSDHKGMLDRSILYTAVTRAKRGCYLFVEDDAMKETMKGRKDKERHSVLSDRLKKALKENDEEEKKEETEEENEEKTVGTENSITVISVDKQANGTVFETSVITAAKEEEEE